jgi:hypothetical protein
VYCNNQFVENLLCLVTVRARERERERQGELRIFVAM